MSHGAGDRELLVLAVVVMVVVIWRVLPSVDAVELLAWLLAGRCRCRRRRKLAALSAACFRIVILKARSPPRNPEGSVLAQEGPAELIFPPKIFIGYIYCNYGAHEHLGGAFANFGSQVGFLCSDCAESDRIDYHALTSDHVRLMAHACVTSSSIAPTSRRFQPQVH